MKNRILAGTGNSNLIKMDLTNINSFSEFKAAAEAGTLPADVIATDDGTGTTQIGTPLTVANLLTDATAASLGVESSDPTLEEAFSSLIVTQAVIDAFDALGVTLTGGAIDAIKALAELLGQRPIKFSLTRDSSISNGAGTGVYDPITKTVRLSFYWQASSAIATSQTIFIVPADYRPSDDTNRGAGIMGTTTQITTAGAVNVNSSGEVKQIATSSASARGMGYIEYII